MLSKCSITHSFSARQHYSSLLWIQSPVQTYELFFKGIENKFKKGRLNYCRRKKNIFHLSVIKSKYLRSEYSKDFTCLPSDTFSILIKFDLHLLLLDKRFYNLIAVKNARRTIQFFQLYLQLVRLF